MRAITISDLADVHPFAHASARVKSQAQTLEAPTEALTATLGLINLKTAKALGLTIPPSVLRRADQVID